MSSTTNLGLPLIDPNQTGKAITANLSLADLDAVLAGDLSIDASAHATPYTIPYDATADEPLGVKTALRFLTLEITGALSGAWVGVFPIGKRHIFYATNNTTGGQTITLKATGGTGINLPAGATVLCLLTATDVTEISLTAASGVSPWDASVFVPGLLIANQLMLRYTAVRPINFPLNFAATITAAASQSTTRVASSGTAVFTISQALAASNNTFTTVGTLTFSTSNVGVFATSSGAFSLAAGDVLRITAPGTPDAALADVGISLSGTR